MHGLGGKQDGEIGQELPLGTDGSQIMRAAAGDHIVQHRIKRELVFARPPGYQLPDVGAVAPDKDRSRLGPAMPRVGGKQSVEITIVSLGGLEGVERLFSLVMAAQSLAELMQRIDALPRSEQWPFAGDFVHQFVDKFKLFERRPAGIPCPPI